MRKTKGHTAAVHAARFGYDGDGDVAFTVSEDATLRRWRVRLWVFFDFLIF